MSRLPSALVTRQARVPSRHLQPKILPIGLLVPILANELTRAALIPQPLPSPSFFTCCFHSAIASAALAFAFSSSTSNGLPSRLELGERL